MNFLSGPQNLGLGIFVIIALPFLIVVLVFMAIIVRSGRRARASRGWPTTSGRILESRVEAYSSRRSKGMHSTMYRPVVQYEYAVNGQHYQGKQVSFGMSVGTRWTQPAENVVAKYPGGRLVEVFYNPANPADAVLEHAANTSNRILSCIVIFIVGLLLVTGVIVVGATGFAAQVTQQFLPK